MLVLQCGASMKRWLMMLMLLLVTACSSTETTTTTGDGGSCPPGDLLGTFYDKPGCNAAPTTACVTPTEDACASTWCGCDGVTFYGGCSNKNEVPFAHEGPCESDTGVDAASDSAFDAVVDATLDAPSDTSPDTQHD